MRRLAALLGLVAATASAQPPADERAKADIVVTGRQRDQAEVRREAHDYVQAVSPPPVDGQFARWNDPICPAVVGIPPALGERLTARIRAIARTAGAPLAKDGCRANAFVTFTPDARRLLATMEQRQPRLLFDTALADRRTLRTGPAPVRWWYGTHAKGSDGNEFSGEPSVAFGPLGTSGMAVPSTDRTRFGDRYSSSLIDTGLRVDITSVVVLVDVPLTTGRRLDAVADYAAMVMLARIRPDPPAGGARTILSLFAGDPAMAPKTLSRTDRAYLATLYAMPGNRPAAMQAQLLTSGAAHAGDGGD